MLPPPISPKYLRSAAASTYLCAPRGQLFFMRTGEEMEELAALKAELKRYHMAPVPDEFTTVRRILVLWRQGQSYRGHRCEARC